MNLESQVTSFELSIKLKELGVKQESYFYYYTYADKIDIKEKQNNLMMLNLKDGFLLPIEHQEYSAFTASELVELLPCEYEINKIKVTYFDGKEINKYFVHHEGDGVDGESCFTDENLCNALAKTIIHIKENNLVEIY